eukprot:353125-Chlamydomonas_euryale.AAC.14
MALSVWAEEATEGHGVVGVGGGSNRGAWRCRCGRRKQQRGMALSVWAEEATEGARGQREGWAKMDTFMNPLPQGATWCDLLVGKLREGVCTHIRADACAHAHIAHATHVPCTSHVTP